MSELDKELLEIYKLKQVRFQDCGKYYATLLRTKLYVPCYTDKEFKPLTTLEKNNRIILAFDSKQKLENWAADNKVSHKSIIAEDFILGLADDIVLWLNINTKYAKCFSNDEIKYLQQRVSKIHAKMS